MFVRLHRLLDVTLDELVERRSLSPFVRTFLGAAVAGRPPNRLVVGGTQTCRSKGDHERRHTVETVRLGTAARHSRPATVPDGIPVPG